MTEVYQDEPASEDPVRRLLDAANDLIEAGTPDPAAIATLLAELESLPPRDLVRFDEQARSCLSGLQWHRLSELRGASERGPATGGWLNRLVGRSPVERVPAEPSPPRLRLWHVLALVSGDGYERERGSTAAPFTPLTARLLAMRCIDWVPPVRDAALARLDVCPHDILVQALPLAGQLAAERARGEILNALLDARLTDEDLRSVYRHSDPLIRRAAWSRLTARGSAGFEELVDVAARDRDVVVRSFAAASLPGLLDEQKRRLADVLLRDRVGWIAVPALAALVDVDGVSEIVAALTARSPALRRAARDWAAIRDVDARSVYRQRLLADPNDALALVALAEMGNAEDSDLFRRMIRDDRSRVRAAGLRALARVDRDAGRQAAVDALQSRATGRVTWAAADVLRDRVPSSAEVEILARIALDHGRTPGQRFRALSLLRPVRWTHLAVLLAARQTADDDRVLRRLDMEVRVWLGHSHHISRAPDASPRGRIERQLPTLDPRSRRSIEFVLRTTA